MCLEFEPAHRNARGSAETNAARKHIRTPDLAMHAEVRVRLAQVAAGEVNHLITETALNRHRLERKNSATWHLIKAAPQPHVDAQKLPIRTVGRRAQSIGLLGVEDGGVARYVKQPGSPRAGEPQHAEADKVSAAAELHRPLATVKGRGVGG